MTMLPVTESFGALLTALGASPGPTLGEQLAALATLKSKLGRKALAEKVGLNEHELGAFEAALADVQRWEGAPAETPRRDDFLRLASLAALQWLEVLCPRVGVAVPVVAASSSLSDEQAAGQVRALELVLRELVHESYRGQDALMARLREVFKAETIAKWSRGGDALTGMSFGELASFFVSRDEYPRYQPVLEVQHYLAMMRERRKTLRSYLDSLRLARNALAHHKPLTAVQRLLVEHYAKEIFAPVSQSWREGRTTVNPDTHLLASTDGLKDWLGALTDDVREVQDELATLKEEVASTRRDVSALEGAVVLILLSGLFLLFTVSVTAWGSLHAPPGLPDLEQAGLATARSVRGLLVSAFTFGLAVVRIILNVTVFRSGGAPWLRAQLTGRRALVPLGLWTALGLGLFFAPIHVSAVETPFQELNMQTSFLALDEAAIERYLARGGNPNAIVNGNSLVHLTILGVDFSDGGVGEDLPRKKRIIQRLLDAGARPSQADRDFAKVMGKAELLPP